MFHMKMSIVLLWHVDIQENFSFEMIVKSSINYDGKFTLTYRLTFMLSHIVMQFYYVWQGYMTQNRQKQLSGM